jgi:hypothetical protein
VPDGRGDLGPLAWFIIRAIHAHGAHFGPVGPIGRYIRRPVPREELAHEVERLRSGDERSEWEERSTDALSFRGHDCETR